MFRSFHAFVSRALFSNVNTPSKSNFFINEHFFSVKTLGSSLVSYSPSLIKFNPLLLVRYLLLVFIYAKEIYPCD